MDRTDRSRRPRSLFFPVVLALGLTQGLGCATMGLDRGKSLVPTGFQNRTGPFLVCTNARLEPDAPVVRQLGALETQISDTLGIRVDPGEKPVEIYLLDDRQAFDHFLQFYYPDLPKRRAFFLANGKQRVVYTFLGDRTEEDVRHEATHALLHVAVGDMPLWLDEGLAEYFEGTGSASAKAPGTKAVGFNPEHVDRLPLDLAAGWLPDLRRLESLKSVREMSPRDYRESWAWVHYLLNDTRPCKAALLGYLGDLRTATDLRPMSDRLGGTEASQLLAHLARLRENPVAQAVAPRDPTVRLQSAPPEQPSPPQPTRIDPPPTVVEEVTPVPPSKRRSLIARVLGWLGS